MNEGSEIVEIRIGGRLGSTYDAWFGVTERIEYAGDDTVLRVRIRDQAALFGLLRRFRDLGFSILSFRYITPAQTDETRDAAKTGDETM